MELVSADNFSLEQLTDAYNQTRIDYIVPMPMNVARLAEYIALYDVDLSASMVARKNDVIFGLGLLGVRRDRAWITRVGVLPKGRRQGTGRAIINHLLASAREKGITKVWIEVIEGNYPANQLFLTSGFTATRDLVVARRPPAHIDSYHASEIKSLAPSRISELGKKEILCLAKKRSERPNWLNEIETLANVPDYKGYHIVFDNGDEGWVGYKLDQLQLTHIVCESIRGTQELVTVSLLRLLHNQHKTQDAIMQNLPLANPHWLGFKSAGYFDVFRRVEMVKIVVPDSHKETNQA